MAFYSQLWYTIVMKTTTVQIEKSVAAALNEIKDHPRQTYNEIISRLILTFHEIKSRNSYDEFLHKIQQPKMTELWDNPEDEEWENA